MLTISRRACFALAVPGVALVALIGSVGFGAEELTPPAQASSVQRAPLVGGPGRVEPESEDIKLGPEMSGKLKKVFVEEGASIAAGQVLAELQNDEYAAVVHAAEAELRAKQAMLRKMKNGARKHERAASWARVREAQAIMQSARSDLERRRALSAHKAVSNEDLEARERAERVAEAKFQQAKLAHTLLVGPAREEDRAIAQAEIDLAQARLDEARARHEKTFIRSPIDGTVLRRHHRDGESVSESSTMRDPVFTVGNTQLLRVRVEIDESDIGRVQAGQKAYVTADAFKNQRFWGTVVRVGAQLGRKNIRTDEPNERVDTKVLEVLIELEPRARLPVGLRVDAFIVTTMPSDVAKLAHP